MKKKELDEIEPVEVTKASRKYKVVVGAKRIILGSESHLIVDFFENKKARLKKPFLRMVFNKEDYANRMENGSWNTKKVQTRDYEKIWNVGREHAVYDEDIFISEDHRDVIMYFEQYVCKTTYFSSWSWSIRNMQDHISFNRKADADEKKDNLMRQRIAKVGKVPEEFNIWVRQQVTTAHIYYKRKGNKVELVCSECGNVYMRKIKTGSYEDMYENTIYPPRQDYYCVCEKCDAMGTYKQMGRAKGSYGFKREVYLVEPYDDDVAIIRYFTVEKYLSIYSKASYSIIEKGRLFIGTQVQQAYWCWYNGDWSRYTPGSYMNYERAEKGRLWPGSNLEETFLKYSQMKEYSENGKKEFSVWGFAKTYRALPELEMVIKTGMTELAMELIQRGPTILERGSTFIEKLGIDKRCLKELVEVKGNWEYLRMMQLEKSMGVMFGKDIRTKLAPYRYQLNENSLRHALQYMTITKFVNRIEKYAGCELGRFGCGESNRRIQHTITTYLDYLDMRDELHHDLNNTIRLYPRDLETEHNIVLRERDAKRQEKYIEDKMKQYSAIPEMFEELCDRYNFEYEEMCIRPAMSAEEIIMEGRLQHHCVGGDSYLDKHNRGETAILLLRHVETPDEPYITIEIRGKTIVQWYGAYDKKPDKEENEAWLDKYVKYLNTGRKPRKRLMVAV